MSAHWLHFLEGFLANPLAVASPVPSGKRLARTIAQQIGSGRTGPVLELGPGTGAVTAAILEEGVSESELVAIEHDPKFAALLRNVYPKARVLVGDAFRFSDVLSAGPMDRNFRAIISGIPVLSQPVETRQRLLMAAIDHLQAGAPFIQFSYGMVPPIAPAAGVAVRRAAFVWQNIPPLHVWVFQRL